MRPIYLEGVVGSIGGLLHVSRTSLRYRPVVCGHWQILDHSDLIGRISGHCYPWPYLLIQGNCMWR